jgi:lipopolysaccharide transport system permease protein
MQIGFFVTPVIWKPDQLDQWQSLLPFNPLFNLLEIVRGPLLGDPMTASVWIGALASSAVLLGAAWVFFIYARGRVAFWV